MYCSNCGNIIVGNGLNCTNCGAVIFGRGKQQNTNGESKVLSGTGEHKRGDANSVNPLSSGNPVIEAEYITIREREKRIIVERLQKDIENAKEQRNKDYNDLIAAESFALTESARIIGERKPTGTPQQVAKKNKISRTKKFLVTTGTFITGLVVFFVCMSYLFWRFAPPNDSHKQQFVSWMTANANGEVNDFLFNDMNLKSYYSPNKDINYSGTYDNKIGEGPSRIYLTYRNGTLYGHYYANGFSYRLRGYTGNKGDFLLLETFNGKTTATITGTLFETGYLTAERVEPTGKKNILSMEKL